MAEQAHHHHHTSSRHHSSHRRHHDYSTTGVYRILGQADTTPIQIDGIEDTAHDDRIAFHTFDPKKTHAQSELSEQRRLRAHRKNARRRFWQQFLKILLIVLGCLAALVLLWIAVSTFGKAKLPSSEGAILPAEGTQIVTQSTDLLP